jgi:UDP-glucose 4-epimerase
MIFLSPFGQRVRLGLYDLQMRILITGGFGFVGGRLSVHLAQAGHNIVLGTRKDVPAPKWLPQAKVTQTKWENFSALELSCADVDVVIHAAGMNAKECASNPEAAMEFNGKATARLVAAANSAAVRRFIYFSTAHVYSNPLVGSITEETFPSNLHPYATSHLAGEQALMNANQSKKFEGTVLRLSNAFGKPVEKDANCWNLLVNDLCRQAVHTRKMTLQTSGLQYRNFINLNEVCRVTEYVASRYKDTLLSGIFNVGYSNSMTLLQMAQLIQKRCLYVLGFKPLLETAKISEGDQSQFLTYGVNKLTKTGYSSIHGNVDEIDNLLIYCKSTFDQSI